MTEPQWKSLTPPVAARRPVITRHHGDSRTDDYAWLRDPGYPDVRKAAILEYLNAENAYREAVMAPLAELQETLFRELKGRLKDDDCGVPIKTGRGSIRGGSSRAPNTGPISAFHSKKARMARPAPFWTSRRWPRMSTICASARSNRRRITRFWPIRPIPTGRSGLRSAYAIWKPVKTCPTEFRTPAANLPGRRITGRCFTSGSMSS